MSWSLINLTRGYNFRENNLGRTSSALIVPTFRREIDSALRRPISTSTFLVTFALGLVRVSSLGPRQ